MLVKLQSNFIFACWKKQPTQSSCISVCQMSSFSILFFTLSTQTIQHFLEKMSCKWNLKTQTIFKLLVTVEETVKPTWHGSQIMMHVQLSCVFVRVKLLNFAIDSFLRAVAVLSERFASYRSPRVTIKEVFLAWLMKNRLSAVTGYKNPDSISEPVTPCCAWVIIFLFLQKF